MKRALLIALCSLITTDVAAQTFDPFASLIAQQTKNKKKRAKKKKKATVPETPPKVVEPPPPPPPPAPSIEEQRVEAAKKKLELERREQSKITPGAPSRWSNKGAMVPIESSVPITAPIPKRNQPILETVETPGQSLIDAGRESLSARLSFSGYHLQTKGQDKTYDTGSPDYTIPVLAPSDRDIDFLRARATMGYQHIAGSDFALRLDTEYRPHISGSRFTDWRINELYASYGLTEQRDLDGPWWGVALGRLAIREAGYAQADGLSLRFRIADWLRAGLFGGITGNPYGYNWELKKTQVISADWITGGAFVGVETSQLLVNVAGVVTYANINPLFSDLDRLYLYLDAAWLILPELNIVVNGWLDMLPGGQLVQNVDGVITWIPIDDFTLSIGGGRFTTVIYDTTIGYAYVADGTNVFPAELPNEQLGPVVGTNGQFVVPYDAVQMTTIYNDARLRAGYRVFRDLDINAKFDFLYRDGTAYRNQQIATTMGTTQPSPVRLLPGAGIRYHNPDLFDANLGFTYIVDKESQAKGVLDFGIGRGLFGLYLSGDGRYYYGDIGAFDGGVWLSYTFPREWFPGSLTLRGAFRYFRENLDIYEPIPGEADVQRKDGTVSGWNRIQNQESYLGFGGIEWRL